MKEMQETIQNLINLMGFSDSSVSFAEDSKRFSIFINDGGGFLERNLPQFVSDMDFVIKMIAKKKFGSLVFIDVNNYRKEREDLIIKLAKAAAKKAVVNKEDVALPPMNAFERRIIHAELSMNPDIKTESMGEGKDRHVVIRPIN